MHKNGRSTRTVNSDSQQIKNSPSIRLMKLLEKIESDKFKPYDIDKYTIAVTFFLILSLIVCYLQIGFSHKEEGTGYHKEILPSDSICYIKDNQAIPLADGAYPIAMPSQDSTLEIDGEEFFPLLLVLVPVDDHFELYPINIADDSLLPRRGKTIALHILFGFTSDHAENKLVYAEKGNDTAAEDYKRKAFYYLVVKNGYGEMQRDYMTSENAGENFHYYRNVDHVMEELITIYKIVNDPNKKFPAFKTTDLNGNEFSEKIFSDHKLTVVNLWVNSQACINLLSKLSSLNNEFADIAIVGLVGDVKSNDDEKLNSAKKIIADLPSEFINLRVNDNFYNFLSTVTNAPTTFFVDSNGYLIGQPVVGDEINLIRREIIYLIENNSAKYRDLKFIQQKIFY